MTSRWVLLLCGLAAVAARPQTPRWLNRALLVQRGGADASPVADAAAAPAKMHDPLSLKEIAALLDRVPVFGVTDTSGSSVVVNAAARGPNGELPNATAEAASEPTLFFFTNADLANAMLAQLEAAAKDASSDGPKPPPMKVSAFSLGRTYCRFKLDASADELGVEAPSQLPSHVNVRFVADPRDVQGAQMLAASLSAPVGGNASAADGGDADAEKARVTAAAEAAVARFNETTVPLFTIAQINVQRGEERMRPWFFSMSHLMALWRNSTLGTNGTSGEGDGIGGGEAMYKQGEVHLSSLDELVAAMRAPSPVDYRRFLFVAYEGASDAVAATGGEGAGAGGAPAGGSADQVGDAVAAAVAKMQAAAGLDESAEEGGGLFD